VGLLRVEKGAFSAACGAPASGMASGGRRCGGRERARSKPARDDQSFPQIGRLISSVFSFILDIA
jgi:hypothetical protein